MVPCGRHFIFYVNDLSDNRNVSICVENSFYRTLTVMGSTYPMEQIFLSVVLLCQAGMSDRLFLFYREYNLINRFKNKKNRELSVRIIYCLAHHIKRRPVKGRLFRKGDMRK